MIVAVVIPESAQPSAAALMFAYGDTMKRKPFDLDKAVDEALARHHKRCDDMAYGLKCEIIESVRKYNQYLLLCDMAKATKVMFQRLGEPAPGQFVCAP